jgi:hypothetical protein
MATSQLEPRANDSDESLHDVLLEAESCAAAPAEEATAPDEPGGPAAASATSVLVASNSFPRIEVDR